MSQKLIAQGILNELLRANAKKGESTRKDLTRQNGQIMAISMGKFKNILRGIFNGITKEQLDKIWKDWDAFLSNPVRIKTVPAERVKELNVAIASMPKRRGTRYYKISTYTIKLKIERDMRNGVTHADRVTVSKNLTRAGTGNKRFFYFGLMLIIKLIKDVSHDIPQYLPP